MLIMYSELVNCYGVQRYIRVIIIITICLRVRIITGIVYGVICELNCDRK